MAYFLEQTQSNLRLLRVLQNLEDELEEARGSFATIVYLIHIQSLYGLRASVRALTVVYPQS